MMLPDSREVSWTMKYLYLPSTYLTLFCTSLLFAGFPRKFVSFVYSLMNTTFNSANFLSFDCDVLFQE